MHLQPQPLEKQPQAPIRHLVSVNMVDSSWGTTPKDDLMHIHTH